MTGIPMAKNQVLSLKVTSIIENKKQIPKSGEVWHRHDILLEDKQGNTSVKEFLSKSPVCREFFIGVYQWVKCKFPNDKGDEIEPTDDPMPPQSRLTQAKQIVNSLPTGTSEGPALPQKEAKNCYSIPLSGQSITFATKWAIDLKLVEISKRKAGSKVTEEDLADVAKWADVINGNICERINF